MDQAKGSNGFGQADNGFGNYQGMGRVNDQISSESKKAAVHAEMARVNKLPCNSSYAVHRMKVLNKILQLLSIPDYLARRGVGAALRRALSVNSNRKGCFPVGW